MMRTRLGVILATLLSLGDFWGVTFAPHPENVGVVVITKCGGKEPVSGYNWVDVDDKAVSARVRKIWVPEGVTCSFIAHVMRQSPDGGPGDTYVGESSGFSN